MDIAKITIYLPVTGFRQDDSFGLGQIGDGLGSLRLDDGRSGIRTGGLLGENTIAGLVWQSGVNIGVDTQGSSTWWSIAVNNFSCLF